MNRESTIDLIHQSAYMLMEYVRKSRNSFNKVRPRDLMLLRHIHCGNQESLITMSQLAQKGGITPAAVSQIISGYEKNNWVRRVRSKQDQRTVYVQLTDEFKEKMDQKWQEHLSLLQCFLDELGDEDCENFERILQKIIEFVEKQHA